MHSVPCEGRSGGIALLWRSQVIKVNVLEANRQFIHARCEYPSKIPLLLTSVYAVPHSNFRSTLWAKLRFMATAIVEPWAIVGDFIDILLSSERIGGSSCCYRRMKWFSDQVSMCGLSDLGFRGPRFIWRGPLISGFSRLYERLDRAFGNDRWLQDLSDAFIKFSERLLGEGYGNWDTTQSGPRL
ncbi:hypothetical protein K1719_007665 [Acacia pycnantha]|nr:hypothetical protein K1719_007665 [Acacia pycnantha]